MSLAKIPQQQEIEEIFTELANQWLRETGGISSTTVGVAVRRVEYMHSA